MNNDQIKEKLLQLADVPDFTVVLSGKKSRKVDGLYKPAIREIILHNKNMSGDNDLMYTAIHEFAHHVDCSASGTPVSGRCHTRRFWATLHRLLNKAEQLGIYSNSFKTETGFSELTEKIREQYIQANGTLMKELGKLLYKAREICFEKHLSFDDYSDRELGIHRSIASALIKIHQLDLDPVIGYENMKTVAGIKNDEKRIAALKGFLRNESPDLVKEEVQDIINTRSVSDDPVKKLQTEKVRIRKTIETLEKKLKDIEERIREYSGENQF